MTTDTYLTASVGQKSGNSPTGFSDQGLKAEIGLCSFLELQALFQAQVVTGRILFFVVVRLGLPFSSRLFARGCSQLLDAAYGCLPHGPLSRYSGASKLLWWAQAHLRSHLIRSGPPGFSPF